MNVPTNVKSILRKLGKNENEIAELCINQATDALRDSGYKDAHLWATNILSSILGEFREVRGPDEMEEWIEELDDVERDVVKAVYDTYFDLAGSLEDSDPEDVKETIIYAISKALDSMDKEKYKKLYG